MSSIIRTYVGQLCEHSKRLHLFGNSLTFHMCILGEWFKQALGFFFFFFNHQQLSHRLLNTACIYMGLSHLPNAFLALFSLNHPAYPGGRASGWFLFLFFSYWNSGSEKWGTLSWNWGAHLSLLILCPGLCPAPCCPGGGRSQPRTQGTWVCWCSWASRCALGWPQRFRRHLFS